MKKFVIVMLKDLKVRSFDTEEDWQAAINTLTTNEVNFIPLRWHAGAEQYVTVEMHV